MIFNRLDRYVLREVLPLFLGGTAAALLLITALRFYQGADALARSNQTIGQVLQEIGWKLPGVLVFTLPVATALAASLATNRLARDNEILALRGSGVRLSRVCAPLFAFSLAAALVNIGVAEWVVPSAWKAQRGAGALESGAFETGSTLRSGSRLIKYDTAQKLTESRRRLTHVLIIERLPIVTIWTAPFASYDAGKFSLEDAMEHRYDASGTLIAETRLARKSLDLPIDFSPTALRVEGNSLSNLSFGELTRGAAEARNRGERRSARELEVNRWFKLSIPAMCLSLGLLAPPLALRFSRAGGFTGVLLSVITVFVAWNTLLLLQYVGEAGLLPPLVAAWSTNVLFGVLGLILLRSAE